MTKMKAICQLEEKHGVDLGNGYKNDHACATFTIFIAKELRVALCNELSLQIFFSLQGDSSTDSANIENELYSVQYLDTKHADGNVVAVNKMFAVWQPVSNDAEGLYKEWYFLKCLLDRHAVMNKRANNVR